jgi:predicted nucleic acid-binding Zn ribbon protein
MGYQRKPKTAGEILSATLGAYHIKDKINEYQAFPHWREIVGDEIADISKPEKIIRGRILVVRVLDAAWAQELAMKKMQLIDQIYLSGKGSMIEDIQFVTGSPRSIQNS